MSSVFHPGVKRAVVVTTYGGDVTGHCVADSSFSVSTEDAFEVRTQCDNMLTGQHQDTKFGGLAVGSNSLTGVSAFTVATRPTTASYTPDDSLTFSTGTAATLIQRLAIGDWNVNLGTGAPQGTTYMVSSVQGGVVCSIAQWRNTFGIRVGCYDRTGARIDARYTVIQIGGGRAGQPFAYAWANKPSAKNAYTPDATFSRSSGGPITIARASLGDYTVTFTGLQTALGVPDIVQITPFGAGFARCANLAEASTATARTVRLVCRDAAGQLADTRFTIALLE